MARGRLTRPWDEESERQKTDDFGKKLYTQVPDADRAVVGEVAKLAQRHGVPMAQVALSWVLQKHCVTAPIIGASKPDHLIDAVAALDVSFTQAEVASLKAPYVPRGVVGYA